MDNHRSTLERSFRAAAALIVVVDGLMVARGVRALSKVDDRVERTGASDPGHASLALERSVRSAGQLLHRNPFDSVTGPLDVEPLVLRVPEAPLVDPLRAPPCVGLTVTGTAEFADPLASSAVVRGPRDEAGRVLRVGDRVGASEVTFIGFNGLDRAPAVWFSQNGLLCQVQLFDQTRPSVEKKDAGRAAPPRPPRTRGSRRGRGLPPEIADRIQRVSASSVRVERGVVDEILARYATYVKGARIRPVEQDGRVVGMRLARLRSNGLLAHLGFQQGDRVETINGFRLTGPEAALIAYAHLRTASELKVAIRRDGRPMVIDVVLQ